jgi:hypothetical protein
MEMKTAIVLVIGIVLFIMALVFYIIFSTQF